MGQTTLLICITPLFSVLTLTAHSLHATLTQNPQTRERSSGTPHPRSANNTASSHKAMLRPCIASFARVQRTESKRHLYMSQTSDELPWCTTHSPISSTGANSVRHIPLIVCQQLPQCWCEVATSLTIQSMCAGICSVSVM